MKGRVKEICSLKIHILVPQVGGASWARERKCSLWEAPKWKIHQVTKTNLQVGETWSCTYHCCYSSSSSFRQSACSVCWQKNRVEWRSDEWKKTSYKEGQPNNKIVRFCLIPDYPFPRYLLLCLLPMSLHHSQLHIPLCSRNLVSMAHEPVATLVNVESKGVIVTVVLPGLLPLGLKKVMHWGMRKKQDK